MKSITIQLSDVDLDVLNSATQKYFKPSVSLMALCGDIIVKEYNIQKQLEPSSEELTEKEKIELIAGELE